MGVCVFTAAICCVGEGRWGRGVYFLMYIEKVRGGWGGGGAALLSCARVSPVHQRQCLQPKEKILVLHEQ